MDDPLADDDRLMIIAGKVHRLPAVKSRGELLAEARARGTHTRAEWVAIMRANRTCHYCDVELNVYNGVQDHRVPLARGGSDAVANLDYICWQCNGEKYLCTSEEWAYAGPRPRAFAPKPGLRAEWARLAGVR